MGCGCVSHPESIYSPQQFGYTSAQKDFLRSLDKQERKDRKLNLQYFQLEAQGSFKITDEFRELVRRKGVPPRFRWRVWKALTGWGLLDKPGEYEKIIKRMPDEKTVAMIEKDLDRTFPGMEAFTSQTRQDLADLLRAHAALFPKVGYCQGMNFVAGFILMTAGHSSTPGQSPQAPKEAFLFLVQLMFKYRANLLFCPNLPLLKLHTFQFKATLAKLFPELHNHFSEKLITPELYLTRWFLTLFTQPLPAASTARIWDLLVCDGLQAVVLVGLATIKLLKPKLLRCDTIEGLLQILSFADSEPPPGDVIVKAALDLESKLLPFGTFSDGMEIRPPKLFAEWEELCPEDVADFRRAEAEVSNTGHGTGFVKAHDQQDPTRSTSAVKLPAIDATTGPASNGASNGAEAREEEAVTEKTGDGVRLPAIDAPGCPEQQAADPEAKPAEPKLTSTETIEVKSKTPRITLPETIEVKQRRPAMKKSASEVISRRPSSSGSMGGRLQSGGPLLSDDDAAAIWSGHNLARPRHAGTALDILHDARTSLSSPMQPEVGWLEGRRKPSRELPRKRPASGRLQDPQTWEVTEVESSQLPENPGLPIRSTSRMTGTTLSSTESTRASSGTSSLANNPTDWRTSWAREVSTPVGGPRLRRDRIQSAKRPAPKRTEEMDAPRVRSVSPPSERRTSPQESGDSWYSKETSSRQGRRSVGGGYGKDVILIDLEDNPPHPPGREGRFLTSREGKRPGSRSGIGSRQSQFSESTQGLVSYQSVGARQAWDAPGTSRTPSIPVSAGPLVQAKQPGTYRPATAPADTATSVVNDASTLPTTRLDQILEARPDHENAGDSAV
eukprot:TRINITY_DN36681_c0_g1_i1.p1 TRINITY_DN36681_c0_g1~~TRINITY_DN36681_c0_g1_i1.p1  ORF type:complete len:841 (-),score=139.07 TRINITY_DN36681_c0_g1_i1:67-2589(-)